MAETQAPGGATRVVGDVVASAVASLVAAAFVYVVGQSVGVLPHAPQAIGLALVLVVLLVDLGLIFVPGRPRRFWIAAMFAGGIGTVGGAVTTMLTIMNENSEPAVPRWGVATTATLTLASAALLTVAIRRRRAATREQHASTDHRLVPHSNRGGRSGP